MRGAPAAIARAIAPCVVICALACPGGTVPPGRDGVEGGRPRAREIGLEIGSMRPGPLDAITDVAGVMVGHRTLVEGDDVRTGVTVILPHGGNIFREKVPGAVFVGNGFGKAAGISQIRELGTIETPIALTSTLSVPEVSAALIEHTLGMEGNDDVMSVNPVVGETNDGYLNDIRRRSVSKEDVFRALRDASGGPVDEGSVGAGTGTRCLGFKGGIGTASRIVESGGGSYTVGVLVQTNFGGMLLMNGAPVGRELLGGDGPERRDSGSCIIVVATDAPLSPASLERLAKRALFAMARTGSFFSNGSGDYSLAFSTVRAGSTEAGDTTNGEIRDDRLNPFFVAASEATEEAIYNSMLRASSVCGTRGRCSEAIPVDEVVRICRHYRVLDFSKRFQTGK